VRSRMFKSWAVAVAGAAAITSAGCGEYLRDQGRAPMQVVILSLEGASGNDGEFGTAFASDVITMVRQNDPSSCTVWGDSGEVTIQLIAKNPTGPAPTPLNSVTFTRYRVEYLRSDRPNAVQGVDVPYAFESGVTFTVPSTGSGTFGFTLVRNTAKLEAPLMALRNNSVLIHAIARVTFWGRDQAGNEVMSTGDIGVTFGDFGSAC
jgi:hypothetical protein